MSAERLGVDKVRTNIAVIAVVAHEAATGAKDGLMMPLNLARSLHERWGVKGVLAALGLIAMASMPSFMLAWDLPRGALLAVLSFPASGVIARLQRCMYN